ncbi:hypothetical protein BTVI_52355 [Pitangus sulphuratus]|nr:hypothetical protein BTVI_52355 [Pitangus sulphuratus]
MMMEDVIARMQDEKNGIPIRTVKSFLSKIPSVFSAHYSFGQPCKGQGTTQLQQAVVAVELQSRSNQIVLLRSRLQFKEFVSNTLGSFVIKDKIKSLIQCIWNVLLAHLLESGYSVNSIKLRHQCVLSLYAQFITSQAKIETVCVACTQK